MKCLSSKYRHVTCSSNGTAMAEQSMAEQTIMNEDQYETLAGFLMVKGQGSVTLPISHIDGMRVDCELSRELHPYKDVALPLENSKIPSNYNYSYVYRIC